MIIFIEGARHTGKTFLISNFLNQVVDLGNRIEYYKFYFADHIRELDLRWLEGGPGLHYFSLGNILTIMEMNQRPQYRDKIWVFDRALVSAYTWSIKYNRISEARARKEFTDIVNGRLYENCKTVFVETDSQTEYDGRNKDMFDMAMSTQEEQGRLRSLIDLGFSSMTNYHLKNGLRIIKNKFDHQSSIDFGLACKSLIDEN